jgi:glycosyltransferase involved in cell wall biosynthesis
VSKKRVIVSATSDLATDQRLSRICSALHDEGFDILATGRLLPGSLSLPARAYRTRRVKHIFNRKLFFYAEYNIRLFIYLLFTRFDILHANDLDTLPANYMASLLKGRPLVYDSHEYFTEVPELKGRPIIKKSWEIIEKIIFPRLKHIITVNQSIAGIYKKKYGKHIHVIRNVPERPGNLPRASPVDYGLPEDKKIVILQGSGINIDRGAEEAVEAMRYVENAVLVIAGSGDILQGLKEKVRDSSLGEKVLFIPPLPYEKLMQLTTLCDCGLSLDKDSSLSYRYSLPNKLFDYIMAGIPVLVTSLPEVRAIVEKYKIGLVIEHSDSPQQIAEKINELLFLIPKESWRENLERASAGLNWDSEKHKLLAVYHQLDKSH